MPTPGEPRRACETVIKSGVRRARSIGSSRASTARQREPTKHELTSSSPMDLTVDNLRKLDPSAVSRAEREEALLEKMQTLSDMLGQVDAAMGEIPESRPSTGRSSRPTPRPPARPPFGQTRTYLDRVDEFCEAKAVELTKAAEKAARRG